MQTRLPFDQYSAYVAKSGRAKDVKRAEASEVRARVEAARTSMQGVYKKGARQSREAEGLYSRWAWCAD